MCQIWIFGKCEASLRFQENWVGACTNLNTQKKHTIEAFIWCVSKLWSTVIDISTIFRQTVKKKFFEAFSLFEQFHDCVTFYKRFLCEKWQSTFYFTIRANISDFCAKSGDWHFIWQFVKYLTTVNSKIKKKVFKRFSLLDNK